MKILDRLPYFPEHRTLSVRGEAVQVRPYQIVVWVSVNIARLREWDSRTPAFPAILARRRLVPIVFMRRG